MRQSSGKRAVERARKLHVPWPIRIGLKTQIAFAAAGLCVHNRSRL